MARLSWAVLCQRVLTDQTTNSVSYIEAVEGVLLAQLPQPLPQIVVGCMWVGSDDEPFQFNVQVLDPEGGVVNVVDAEPQALPAGAGLRTNIALTGASVEHSGTFQVRVRQKHKGRWRTEAAIPLVVEVHDREG